MSSAPARLYVDRVFSLRGIGTVATGTLWSGTIGEGDVLRAEPGGRDVRVRSIQVHDRPVERAEPGQRVALALPGVERSELRRGDALVAPGSLQPSYRLDVALEELAPIADGARLHVHHGTVRGARARRQGGRLRAAAARGARRRRAWRPGRAPRRDDRRRRHRARPGSRPPRRPGALRAGASAARRGSTRRCSSTASGATRTSGWPSCRRGLERARSTRPIRSIPALPPRPSRGRRTCSHACRSSGAARCSTGPARPARSARAQPRPRRSAAALVAAEPGAVKAEDAELARFLERAGRLVRLGGGWAVSAAAYERARTLVLEECAASGQITLARFRDLAGCGRRDAQLLLERLDADGVTRRVGEARVLRRRASATAS